MRGARLTYSTFSRGRPLPTPSAGEPGLCRTPPPRVKCAGGKRIFAMYSCGIFPPVAAMVPRGPRRTHGC
eukprot:2041156-Alexandrium_andersonii.AAC.1